jgi:hypothetical protein
MLTGLALPFQFDPALLQADLAKIPRGLGPSLQRERLRRRLARRRTALLHRVRARSCRQSAGSAGVP